jgi:type I restriction enzyme S subunit
MNIIEEENDEVLTLLPETWLWVVLDDLIEYMDSGWSPQCEDHPRSSMECWGVLKTTAVQSLSFDDKHHKELPSKLQPRPQHEAGACDILVTRAGPKNRVGISCVIDKVEPRLMISDKIIRFRVADKISPRYVALALNTGRSGEAVEQAKTGMAVMQMNISQVRLRAVPIPLPPLAEQHRIVAKVDELMALCDQLEQQLSQADQQRRRLLEAVLAEALMEPEAALALEKNYEQGATV